MSSVAQSSPSGGGRPLRAERPPRAVVGSQISQDEIIFGSALDRGVVRRFFTYVKPYRKRLYFAIAAVLVFFAEDYFDN